MAIAEPWVEATVGPVRLPDVRLERRLAQIVETLAAHPEQSIPQASGTWAQTKATYNFFGNPRVHAAALRDGQAEATAERCRKLERVLVVQDTTSLDYTSHPKLTGVGPLETAGRQGLFVHTGLALSREGVAQGLLSQEVWARDAAETGKAQTRHQRPVEGKESARWLRGVAQTEARLGPDVQAITVADREADIYELFALAQSLRGDWVIRAQHDRRLDVRGAAATTLVERVEAAAVLGESAVVVGDKPAQAGKPPQPGRTARLQVRTTMLTIPAPAVRAKEAIAAWWETHPAVARLAPAEREGVALGVVLAEEVDPPLGVTPLRWLLLTSLPVLGLAEAQTVLECYRLRWLVERYHFILKSGCRIEGMQLETAEHLERALAVYAAVAWRVLWLTYLARSEPEAPCTQVLAADVWPVLWRHTHPKQALPEVAPTLRAAVRAIAGLGGFLGRKGDGEPGVQTIWRGLRRLDDFVAAWRLAQQSLAPNPATGSPQSHTCSG